MKKWTEDEISHLESRYSDSSNIELCKYFNISRGTLTKKARELGVIREAKWSKEKEKYLCSNYERKTLRQLAKDMGVSIALVRQKNSS